MHTLANVWGNGVRHRRGYIWVHAPTPACPHHRMDTPSPTASLTRSVWLNGVRRHAEFTLVPGSSGDYTFARMTLAGETYPVLESSDGFAQWIYLVCPEAYRMAFRTRRPYILASNAFQHELGVVVWDVTVNHLLATCTASGLRAEPRHFRLVFGTNQRSSGGTY